MFPAYPPGSSLFCELINGAAVATIQADASRPGDPQMIRRLTAIIQRENGGYVPLCPELDVASQGDSIESARENLREALELFFECASPAEIQDRLGSDVFVTQIEVALG
jgi:predicted RNase H-like HicB family nuclease